MVQFWQIYVLTRVQAENKKNSRPTFLMWFYPRIDLAPFFWQPEFVFTYLIGRLGSPLWPPLAISPLQTGLPRTSEMIVKTGIFGSFSHISYRILPQSQRTFQIQNSLPLQKVMLVWLNPISLPLRGVSQDQPISPFCLENWLGASFLAEFYIFFSGKPPNSVGALGSKNGCIYGL